MDGSLSAIEWNKNPPAWAGGLTSDLLWYPVGLCSRLCVPITLENRTGR